MRTVKRHRKSVKLSRLVQRTTHAHHGGKNYVKFKLPKTSHIIIMVDSSGLKIKDNMHCDEVHPNEVGYEIIFRLT